MNRFNPLLIARIFVVGIFGLFGLFAQAQTTTTETAAEIDPTEIQVDLVYSFSADGFARLTGLALVVALPEGVDYLPGSVYRSDLAGASRLDNPDPRDTPVEVPSGLEPADTESNTESDTGSNTASDTGADTAETSIPEPRYDANTRTLVFDLPPDAETIGFVVVVRDLTVFIDPDVSLLALTPAPELLRGDPDAVQRYLQAVALPEQPRANPDQDADQDTDRQGLVILSPTEGTVVSGTSSSDIVVEAPLGSETRLLVNNTVIGGDRIGRQVSDPTTGRLTLEYIGVGLQRGPNLLRAEAITASGERLQQDVNVALAGPARNVSLVPLTPIIANTTSPLLLDVLFTDEFGNPASEQLVTITVDGTAPSLPDVNRERAGYQLLARDGVVRLGLEPVATTGELTLSFVTANRTLHQTLRVDTNVRPWMVVGSGSLAGTFAPSGFRVDAATSLFARGPVLEDAFLTLGLNLPPDPLGFFGNPSPTFGVLGSSGVLQNEAASRQGVYIRLEHDVSFVQYGDGTGQLVGPLAGVSRSATGLTWRHRPIDDGGFGLGYAALVPSSRLVEDLEIASDGTSFYRLPDAPIDDGTVAVYIAKRSEFSDDLILEDDTDPLVGPLAAGRGFVANEQLGTVRLSRPLPLRDAAGNRYVLLATYRIRADDGGRRTMQFGTQFGYDFGPTEIRASTLFESRERRGAVYLVSAAVATDTRRFQGEAEVAYAGDDSGSGAGFAVRGGYREGPVRLDAELSYLDPNYRSPLVENERDTGLAVGSSASVQVSPDIGLEAEARYRRRSDSSESLFRLRGVFSLGEIDGVGDNVSARVGGQLDNGDPRLDAGLSLLNVFGLERTRLELYHAQGLGGATSLTTLTAGYQLLENLELELSDTLEWGIGNTLLVGLVTEIDNRAVLGRAADFGSSTLRANYRIPGGVSAAAGELNIGVSTSLPLSERLSFEPSFEQVLDFDDSSNNATVLATALRYDDDDGDGNARLETRFGPGGTKLLFSGGANLADTDPLFWGVGTSVLYEAARTPSFGLSLRLDSAYRGDGLTFLGTSQLYAGSLSDSGGFELLGDLRFEVPIAARTDARLGYRYRYLEESRYQDLITLGSSVGLWQGGSAGLYGRLFNDYDLGSELGFTLELSQQLACGLYGVAGYSSGGTSDPVFGRNGFQLRLDVAVDEQWRCGRRERDPADEASHNNAQPSQTDGQTR
ncbi:MAG: hypothetical protein U5L04_04525 [Trueperaceae bacterium]|nr:hypothetical protein [Trueperaceae bacterium]